MMLMLHCLFSVMFIFLTHPLSLGMMLLIQTTMISFITGTFSHNFWFSYILYLIMIGGMLILFVYMTSIASNEKFSFNFKFSIITLTLIATIMMFPKVIVVDLSTTNSLIYYYENKMNLTISMNKYINTPMNMVFMFMIVYLFITMIAIVKIISKNKGPIRQMN